MIELVTGSMFDIDADILINTVNCVGVMGCGVALAFKYRYPHVFAEYRNRCRSNQIKPGILWNLQVNDGKTIVHFPTKQHWKNPSQYIYIENGLRELRTFLSNCKGSVVALPAIGCGHGGLDWDIVWEMIQETLGDLEHITINVFQPQDSKLIGGS